MIIGISSKFDFGAWHHKVYTFENQQEAEKWLHTEEYDFRERELFTDEKQAVQLAGIESVANAVEGIELEEPELWKALRKVYGITQAKISEITGIPKRTIEDWENGRRKPAEYMLDLVESKLKEWDNGRENIETAE